MIYALKYDVSGRSKQEDHKVQKALSRWCLAESLRRELNREPDFADMAFGPHGKPYLKDGGIFFNLSNCKGLICCAVHRTEVGIDAEAIRPYNPRLARRVCTSEEVADIEAAPNRDEAFIRYWTLKEGFLKYTGDGLGYGAKNVAFYYTEGNPRCKTFPETRILQKFIYHNGKMYIMSIFTKDAFYDEICYLSNENDTIKI